MLYLRPYKKQDAQTIISWCENEDVFRKWTADRYDTYPIDEADMNYKYFDQNGDCTEADNFYPMTACDENGMVGHFIIRYVGGDRSVLRLGFVIVDDKKRGQGFGKKMIQLAVEFAFNVMGAQKLTMGVFENNPQAYHCYKAAGFKDAEGEQEVCELFGKSRKILELEIDRNDYLKQVK